ncbi:hypothetical protein DFP72DRAFT_1069175 [Ephemerocybe angulata]|uniref:Uncharacterized protein n=1 Tax=Ephemerocybe angulata TaxID=980116 RepID=A0A8H6M660_9AGAR|nr:hypothetical protein DFP72DRAFT_1069175 [Tulosesus angulatus]
MLTPSPSANTQRPSFKFAPYADIVDTSTHAAKVILKSGDMSIITRNISRAITILYKTAISSLENPRTMAHLCATISHTIGTTDVVSEVVFRSEVESQILKVILTLPRWEHSDRPVAICIAMYFGGLYAEGLISPSAFWETLISSNYNKDYLKIFLPRTYLSASVYCAMVASVRAVFLEKSGVVITQEESALTTIIQDMIRNHSSRIWELADSSDRVDRSLRCRQMFMRSSSSDAGWLVN